MFRRKCEGALGHSKHTRGVGGEQVRADGYDDAKTVRVRIVQPGQKIEIAATLHIGAPDQKAVAVPVRITSPRRKMIGVTVRRVRPKGTP